MKIKNISKMLAVVLAVVMIATLFVGCKKEKYDMETTPFVMSIQELDGVFNGYYSTSGPDGQVTGMTQISMFDTDANGKAVWGGERPCLTLAYNEEVVYGNTSLTVTEDTYTDYTYVLKPNVKFSDGSSVSIKDVLFSYYVVLDPVYTGSSTMYSTEIMGLNQYREQTTSEESTGLNNQFVSDAESRVERLAQAVFELRNNRYNNLDNYLKTQVTTDTISVSSDANGVKTYTYNSFVLEKLIELYGETSEIVNDYKYVSRTFYEELETDYASASSIDFSPNASGNYPYPNITTPQQYFMLQNGDYIDTDRKTGDALASNDPNAMINKAKSMTREECIMRVYQDNMPGSMADDNIRLFTFYQVVNGWATAYTIRDRWSAEAKEAYFSEVTDKIDHIYGITWNEQFKLEGTDSVSHEAHITPSCYDKAKDAIVIGGVEYPLATYTTDAQGNKVYKDGYEVLNVRIKKVDPKAIWSFAVSVTPMEYYSNDTITNGWNGGAVPGQTANFGVAFSSTNFYNNTVRGKNVPLGAGAYKASSLVFTQFYRNNVVSYERNDYFYTLFCDQMGNLTHTPAEKNAKIKYVQYKVTNTNTIMDALETSDGVDYADPNATATNINTVNRNKDLYSLTVDNLGYGYIGINAGQAGLENVHVRRAIMHAMETPLVLDYYTGNLASNIWYPMSSVSWAYPDDASATNFRYPFDDTADHSTIKSEMDLAISTSQGSGVTYSYDEASKQFMYEGKKLKLTFTIAGSTDDHPAWAMMQQAAEILNGMGWDVTVKNDSQTLSKLSNGELQVWAAAWQSAIDPDMYQVYHIESTATSTFNWGYREIKRSGNETLYATELDFIEELSQLIEDARSTLVQNDRIDFYKDCLDLVMELAVELPTYQRKNMYAFNIKKLNIDTMITNCTPYEGPLSRIWEVEYNK